MKGKIILGILIICLVLYSSIWVHELTHKYDARNIIKDYENICVLNDCSNKLDKICEVYGCSNFLGSWLGYYYNAINNSNEQEIEKSKIVLKNTDSHAYLNQLIYLTIIFLIFFVMSLKRNIYKH